MTVKAASIVKEAPHTLLKPLLVTFGQKSGLELLSTLHHTLKLSFKYYNSMRTHSLFSTKAHTFI